MPRTILGHARRGRQLSQHCWNCKYSLDGLPVHKGHAKCPECGKLTSLSEDAAIRLPLKAAVFVLSPGLATGVCTAFSFQGVARAFGVEADPPPLEFVLGVGVVLCCLFPVVMVPAYVDENCDADQRQRLAVGATIYYTLLNLLLALIGGSGMMLFLLGAFVVAGAKR